MSEPVASKVQAWALPNVAGPIVSRRRVDDLAGLEREAWQAGYAAGEARGIAQALADQKAQLDEQRQRVARLDALLALMARPLEELDAAMHAQLAGLAGAIARQLVRRELRTQPDQIIAVIRETLALLPAAAREVRLHVHPEDAALVRERLVEPNAERAWTLLEDPVVSRGGCRVTSENSTIDAQVEARLGAAIAAALGDERATPADTTTARRGGGA
jgi:flagellar assembly protein FliH